MVTWPTVKMRRTAAWKRKGCIKDISVKALLLLLNVKTRGKVSRVLNLNGSNSRVGEVGEE